MVLGFTDVMRMLPSNLMAEKFYGYMTRKNNRLSIKDAWLKTASHVDVDPNLSQTGTGAVIFDETAADDYLPGYGSYARGTTFVINDHEEER